jgi:peptide/nickel transport system ATP-binding protein
VDDVSFTIAPGAAVGLVGASGSGKSTLANMITGSERSTGGSITFGDVAVGRLRAGGLRRLHRQVQMVFQDPYGALNPLHTVEYTVMRPAQNFLAMSARQARLRAADLLETVGLTPASQFAAKLPHQLSGGQRQRVVIARALACDPGLIVADEPVSMLDVSLRAGVLKLLAELRRQRGLSLLYITHDLLSARVITDEILVLNQGQVVERGPTRQVLQHPRHPYTIQLLNAVANPLAAAAAGTPSQGRHDS